MNASHDALLPAAHNPFLRRTHEGPRAADARRRIVAQSLFETKMILRNGEQLMVTILLPVLLLLGLTRTGIIDLDTGGASRTDFVTPGILALAVMSCAFTSQAIATAFDRRNGVLRLMSTTPLGRGGLLAAKVAGVLVVEAVQIVVLAATALTLGWRPVGAGVPLALVAVLLGTAAFTALAMLLAGTIRAEGVLALGNVLLVLLTVGGGVLLPAEQLPGGLGRVVSLLPSGALGEAMRAALLEGTLPLGAVAVLVVWSVLLGWAAARFFRWH